MTTPSLSSRIIQGAIWNYLGVLLRILLQLVVVIVYARILGPAPLGFLSLATMILGLGGLVVAFGLGEALVQKPALSQRDVSGALNIVLSLSIAAGVVLYLGAESIGSFFGSPGLGPYISALSIFFPVFAVNTIAKALMKRRLDLKYLSLVQVFGYFSGFLVIGLPIALEGFGEGSFVAALVGQEFVILLMLLRKVRGELPILSGGLRFSGISFGFDVMKANIANWTIENVDNFLIGHVRGVSDLGLYSISYNLVRTPVNHVVKTMQAVLFPATSRLQNEERKVGKMFYATLSILSLIVFPVFLGVSAVSGTIVDALYGEAWEMAAVILIPISLSMPIHAVMAITGPMLWGVGRADREYSVAVRVALVMVPVLYIAAQFSLVAAAWCVLVFYCLRAGMMLSSLVSYLNLSWRSILLSVRGGVLVGAVTAAFLWLGDLMMMTLGWSSVLRLVALMVEGLVVLVVGVLIWRTWILTAPVIELGGLIAGPRKEGVLGRLVTYLIREPA